MYDKSAKIFSKVGGHDFEQNFSRVCRVAVATWNLGPAEGPWKTFRSQV